MNRSSTVTDSIRSVPTSKRSETRQTDLQQALQVNSIVRLVMDSLIIAVVLVISFSARQSIAVVSEINRESLMLHRQLSVQLHQITDWIDEHRKAEAELVSKIELFRSQVKAAENK